MTLAALPGWRRPVGVSWSAGDAEQLGLREALLELCTDEPQSLAELAAAVREHWGEATRDRIRTQLRELERDGRVRCEDARYTRVEVDVDEQGGR